MSGKPPVLAADGEFEALGRAEKILIETGPIFEAAYFMEDDDARAELDGLAREEAGVGSQEDLSRFLQSMLPELYARCAEVEITDPSIDEVDILQAATIGVATFLAEHHGEPIDLRAGSLAAVPTTQDYATEMLAFVELESEPANKSQNTKSRAKKSLAAETVANGDEGIVRRYLAEMGEHSLLTGEEEVELAQRIERAKQAKQQLEESDLGALSAREQRRLMREIKAGDEAREQFIVSNLRLVVSIAKRYGGDSLSAADRIQIGNIGLMRAVEKFDWRRGFKFSTYASWWIRQAIQRGSVEEGYSVYLPHNKAAELSRLKKATQQFIRDNGRDPVAAEIAVLLDITVERATEYMVYDQRRVPHSLDAEVPSRSNGYGRSTALQDILVDADAIDPAEQAVSSMATTTVQRIMAVLNPRQREILSLRFGLEDGEPRTLEETGQITGMTRENVRLHEAKAMSRIRHPSVRGGLRG